MHQSYLRINPICVLLLAACAFFYCFSWASAQTESIDIGVEQRVAPSGDLRPHQTVFFIMTVTNHGDEPASDITLTDTYPDEVTPIKVLTVTNGAQIVDVDDYPDYKWTINNLAPNDWVQIFISGEISGDLDRSLEIDNDVSIFYPGDQNPTNNQSTVSTRVAVPPLSFVEKSVFIMEASTTATLTVSLDESSLNGPVTVDYAVEPDPVTPGAAIPDDLLPISGTLLFEGNKSSTNKIAIEVVDDTVFEGDERFRLSLSNARGASLPINNQVLITVEDDESSVQSITTSEDSEVTIPLMILKSHQSPITITTKSPAHGALRELSIIEPSVSSIAYTPALDFNGKDRFTYIVTDVNGVSSSGVIELDITPVNDPPTIDGDTTLTVSQGITLETTLMPWLETVMDVDTQDSHRIDTVPATSPQNGDLTIREDASFRYIPAPDFMGSDIFRYRVCDDGIPSLCAESAVTIEVTAGDGVPPDGTDGPEGTVGPIVFLPVLSSP